MKVLVYIKSGNSKNEAAELVKVRFNKKDD